MKPMIFSVEDDTNIQNVIQIALTNSNYDIQTFQDAVSLFDALKRETPDLFLLDVMLPDENGIQILKRLKADSTYNQIPVMIISAKSSELDRVIGLDSGADDYLVKPFGVLELVSRIKALLRRYQTEDVPPVLQIGPVEINQNNYTCHVSGREISLTHKQFDLLFFLMQKSKEVVSREDILNKIWGYEFIGETRTLDVHIKEIRRKLHEAGLETKAIETVRGVGYRFIL